MTLILNGQYQHTPGEFTGQWVERHVSGRWKRVEKYEVGTMVSEEQYAVYIEGNRDYPAVRWGWIAVRDSLTTPPARCADCDVPVFHEDYLCYRCREEQS